MPVTFLSEEQQRRYARYDGEPSAEDLARYFYLSDVDLELIRRRRWDYMRLGFALQLGTVRYLGTFIDRPVNVPPGVISVLAEQLGIAANCDLSPYMEGNTRWTHAEEIRRTYGYEVLASPVIGFRLMRWLFALCWTGTDRPSVLFQRAEGWLREHKVLLPGLTTLERVIAKVRDRATQRLWRHLTYRLTPEQRLRLELLPRTPEAANRSTLDRLRDGPTRQTSGELLRAIQRLNEIASLADGMPSVQSLPASRVQALARFASAARAAAVARLPDDRRAATLLAFVHTLFATAHDDVLDLFDVVVADHFRDAKFSVQKKRQDADREYDKAAPQLDWVLSVVMDQSIPDLDVRRVVFSKWSPASLALAWEHVQVLQRDVREELLLELRKHHRRLRFLDMLIGTVTFGASPAGMPVLQAIGFLRLHIADLVDTQEAPLEFVPKDWQDRMHMPSGDIDMAAYRLCLAEAMQLALRRRDLYVMRSLRYTDPRKGLLEGSAWQSVRTTVCRSLGVMPIARDELARLTAALDQSYRITADNLAANPHLRFEDEDQAELVLSTLEAVPDADSLVALRAAIRERMPEVDLPEIVLEIHRLTQFAEEFTHIAEASARAPDLLVSICAVLVSGATNVGDAPFVRDDVPALSKDRLSWVRQNYIRAETIAAANARLVAAQNKIDIVRAWGNGEVASADGLRFVVPVKTVHAGPNPKYFGRERGVTYYNLVSNQYTGLNGIVVPGTLKDSLILLALILEQETDLKPVEIMTDTGAYADVIFGIFYMLGYQFSPRIADVMGSRFWRVDREADYGPLDKLSRHYVNTKIIEDNWEDMLRLTGSLKLGVIPAAGLMRTLQTSGKPTELASALANLGRMAKTLHNLRYIDDETYRRRILVQLNRGEERHGLSRHVFHGQRGELRQKYREGQEDQLDVLGLVVNMITLWNTIYQDAIIKQLRLEGFDVRDEDIARLSPLIYEHINVHGRYSFTLPEQVARGQLRPVTKPKKNGPWNT